MSQDPLHVVWVEPRFPGRLGAVADWLTRKRGYRSTFYCQHADPADHWPSSVGKGIELRQYAAGGAAIERSVAWPRSLERGLCHAFGLYETLERDQIRAIDLIVGRSNGLGSGLFAGVYAPAAPVVTWLDGYLHPRSHDLADDAPPHMPDAYYRWRRSSGAMDLLDLENAQAALTPTDWQRSTYPVAYHDAIQVAHEGVDLRCFRPREGRPRTVAGKPLPPNLKLITFVARSLDRLRGLDRFLAIADRLVSLRDDVIFAVAGETIVNRPLDVEWHGQAYLDSLRPRHPRLDPSKLHILGLLNPTDLAHLLASSDLHLSPSRVHATSRSTLEAMATGTVVLASDTTPHRDVFDTGLVSGNDLDAWVERSIAVLDDTAESRAIGEKQRAKIISRFDRGPNLSMLATYFDRLVERKRIYTS